MKTYKEMHEGWVKAGIALANKANKIKSKVDDAVAVKDGVTAASKGDAGGALKNAASFIPAVGMAQTIADNTFNNKDVQKKYKDYKPPSLSASDYKRKNRGPKSSQTA